MIRKNRPRSSSLFLMELILAILFFSIASAVCVQFFVKSHLLSRDSNALNHAANECANVAEVLDTADSPAECAELLNHLYPEGTYPDTSRDTEAAEIEITLCYNEAFLPCSTEAAVYTLYIHISHLEQMLTADLEFCNEASNVLYELHTEHHIARRTGYEK